MQQRFESMIDVDKLARLFRCCIFEYQKWESGCEKGTKGAYIKKERVVVNILVCGVNLLGSFLSI